MRSGRRDEELIWLRLSDKGVEIHDVAFLRRECEDAGMVGEKVGARYEANRWVGGGKYEESPSACFSSI